jgi:CubicO group peptidase (beta-lactamase class C family)
MNRLDEIFDEAIQNGTFPGGVLLVGNHEKVLFEKSYGTISKDSKEPVSIDTIYDLASMTKVTATTPAIMKLVEDGRLRLYDPVSLFLDEFKVEEKKEIRIFHPHVWTSFLLRRMEIRSRARADEDHKFNCADKSRWCKVSIFLP